MPLTPESERQLSVLQYLLNQGGWVSYETFAAWNVGAQDLYGDLLATVRAQYVTQEGTRYGLTDKGDQRLLELQRCKWHPDLWA